MDELDDIIKEFLVESYENLDQLDRDLLSLEDEPENKNLLSSVFRTIHTIKGTCGFLGFPILEHVAHVGESLLVKLRDGEMKLDGTITSGLLAMVDAIRTMLANIETTKSEGEDQYETVVTVLEELRTGKVIAAAAIAVVDVHTCSSSEAASAPEYSEVRGPSAEVKSLNEHLTGSIENLETIVADLTQSSSKSSTRSRKAKKTTASKSKEQTAEKPTKKPRGQTTQSRSGKKEITSSDIPASERVDEIVTTNSSVVDVQETVFSSISPERIGLDHKVPAPPLCTTAAAQVTIPAPQRDAKRAAASGAEGDGNSETGDKGQSATESTVRLDVALLDRLMNLVGELVLARNQIIQFSHSAQDASLIAASQRLNLITTELQEGVMKTRMQPIRNAWNKLPRVVRDLSLTCGKRVNVEMEGADTELDKTILEAIKDPLTHIVRNSVDHGIESPNLRVVNGKPAEGTLYLRAFHEGGQVNIEIADDGGGIHLERVRAKAVEKGLISAEQAAAMPDREAMNLILLPGFSTAAKVTNVSGRGVGMDVVKTNVERIGGTLDINSIAGRGTTLRIKIPLTMAIVPALVVTCGGDRYCIPQVSLLELVRLDGDAARDQIEVLHSIPVYRLRGQLLPLVYLDEELGLNPRRTTAERRQADTVNIVILQAEDRQFGLVVDHISDTQEIVVKPLGQHLKGIGVYAGSTIMGDGAVALILDVIGIARQGHAIAERGGRPLHESSGSKNDAHATRQSYLIVDPGDGSRSAIPLSAVARLEEFRPEQIERSGHQAVVQYRGEIMPLVSVDGGYGAAGGEKGTIPVVVFREDKRNIGVMVSRIVDIVEHDLAVEPDHNENGSIAVSPQIISGRVTQVIDLKMLIGV